MRPRELPVVFLVLLLDSCAASAPPQAPASPSAPPVAAPVADPAADPAHLAVPGPAAAACTDDAACVHHRCNLAYGKCAFPCVTDADCAHGTICFKSVISTCQPRPPNVR
jgi:hypothetical protein